jgi:hypothetical protein
MGVVQGVVWTSRSGRPPRPPLGSSEREREARERETEIETGGWGGGSSRSHAPLCFCDRFVMRVPHPRLLPAPPKQKASGAAGGDEDSDKLRKGWEWRELLATAADGGSAQVRARKPAHTRPAAPAIAGGAIAGGSSSGMTKTGSRFRHLFPLRLYFPSAFPCPFPIPPVSPRAAALISLPCIIISSRIIH